MVRLIRSVGLASGLMASGAAAQPKHFTPDDLPKLVRISDPQISPDGKTVAFVVSRANLKEDRYDSELDLVDVHTRQLRVMTRDRLGVGSPRWSPTGDRIGFLAEDANKKTQIFVLPISGGEARQLTEGKTAVSLLAWRPDGAALAFAASEEQAEKKDEAKFEDAFEVGDNNYTERSRPQPTHIWTVTVSDGSTRQITHGAWSLPNHLAPAAPPSQIAWTPDGGSILFVKADTPITGDSETSRLGIVSAVTGAVRAVIPADVEQSTPILSPDGRQVAYAFPRDGRREYEQSVYVAPLTAGRAPAEATRDIDRDVALIGWSPDGKAIVVGGNDGVRSAIWIQTLNGGAARLDVGGLNPTPGGSVGQNGGIVFGATDDAHPVELYYVARIGEKPIQLTHLQTVAAGLALGRQEMVHWKSDAFDVQGVLTYPPNYVSGKPLPLVLYLHGGPSSASLQTFAAPAQILAGEGWLVLEPNYRGSNNAGNGFQTAIYQDAGAGPGRDVMAGVALLEQRGLVDKTRIAVSGWSYGGYMTSWLIGNYPEVWRAAVAGAPVTDLVDQYTLSDNNIERTAEYGPSPFVGDNLKAYAAQSPITYAWRVKAPTLIMSDVGDWRVTTTQAYKLYHALRDNRVPVSFVAFPVPGHSPSDPIRYRDVWRRWSAWLGGHLNAPATDGGQ